MYQRIELNTLSEVNEFVSIVSKLPGNIFLQCDNYCGNAKSILGVMASLEWDRIYINSENDIYNYIEKFCV